MDFWLLVELSKVCVVEGGVYTEVVCDCMVCQGGTIIYMGHLSMEEGEVRSGLSL